MLDFQYSMYIKHFEFSYLQTGLSFLLLYSPAAVTHSFHCFNQLVQCSCLQRHTHQCKRHFPGDPRSGRSKIFMWPDALWGAVHKITKWTSSWRKGCCCFYISISMSVYPIIRQEIPTSEHSGTWHKPSNEGMQTLSRDTAKCIVGTRMYADVRPRHFHDEADGSQSLHLSTLR